MPVLSEDYFLVAQGGQEAADAILGVLNMTAAEVRGWKEAREQRSPSNKGLDGPRPDFYTSGMPTRLRGPATDGHPRNLARRPQA